MERFKSPPVCYCLFSLGRITSITRSMPGLGGAVSNLKSKLDVELSGLTKVLMVMVMYIQLIQVTYLNVVINYKSSKKHQS